MTTLPLKPFSRQYCGRHPPFFQFEVLTYDIYSIVSNAEIRKLINKETIKSNHALIKKALKSNLNDNGRQNALERDEQRSLSSLKSTSRRGFHPLNKYSSKF